MTLKRKKCKKLLNTAQWWSLSKNNEGMRDKSNRNLMSLICSEGVWFGREKSPGMGNKGSVMSMYNLFSEHLDSTTLGVPTTHLEVSDDHLTPMCRPSFYTLLEVSQCTLFLSDSGSSSHKPPRACNLRKILWVIQQKRIAEKLISLVCTIHHWDSLGAYGLQGTVLIPLQYWLLKP